MRSLSCFRVALCGGLLLTACSEDSAVRERAPAALSLSAVDAPAAHSANFSLPAAGVGRLVGASTSDEPLEEVTSLLRLAEDEAAISAVAAAGVVRGALARQFFEQSVNAASSLPASPDELRKAREQMGESIGYPRLVRTARYTVSPEIYESEELARSIAEEVIAAAIDVTDAEAFAAAADTVDTRDLQVSALQLPPVDVAGKSYVLTHSDYGAPPFSQQYAAVAHLCDSPGVLPELAADEQGIHVILCQEVHPAWALPEAEADLLTQRQLGSGRAGAAVRALLANLRAHNQVTQHPKAEALMRRALGQP